MPARKPRPKEKPQGERFIETAREIGASEHPRDFERIFAKVMKTKKKLMAKRRVTTKETG